MDGASKRAATPSDDPEAVEKDRQFVTALARGLEVLRCFRAGDVGLGNQEIAERTGLPKPTVSRLTYTLTRLGYLGYDERLGIYELAPGVLALGYAMLSGVDIRARARPLMQALADEVDLSVALGGRDRLSMVYLESCRGPGAVTLRLDVGTRIPMATTAMGRALLAALPASERAYLLGHMERKYGKDFPRLRKGIERAVREVAAQGFCLSLGDWQSEVHAVGVPLAGLDGNKVYALNCGGPSFRLAPERLQREIGPRLVELAERLKSGA